MTRKQAIKTAANRVAIVRQGEQYVVHTWSPKHNATYVSHPMTREAAMVTAWGNKLETALELLGVEDANEIVHREIDRGPPRPDWRSLVKRP